MKGNSSQRTRFSDPEVIMMLVYLVIVVVVWWGLGAAYIWRVLKGLEAMVFLATTALFIILFSAIMGLLKVKKTEAGR
jgi:uncharacterized membrane protein YwzB